MQINEIIEEFEKKFIPDLVKRYKEQIDIGDLAVPMKINDIKSFLRKELEARDKEVANDVVDFIIAHSVQDRAMPHMKLVNEKVLDTARSLHLHEEKGCCDGECNHDDCCGKIPENCTHTKDLIE